MKFGLKEVLQDVFTEEVEDTWRIVFNYVISKMKDGIRQNRTFDSSVIHLEEETI